MPRYNFYKRRRFYKRPWNKYRRRRFRKPFRTRLYRRRATVRRRRFFKKPKRKLKKLKIQQWQPNSIRKCKIRGTFSLFAAAYGRYYNDYEIYRESWVPEKEPGGGGWSTFKLSLENLYDENERLLNWWSHSNKLLNLVRYTSCTLRFYRTEEIDYVATYSTNYPMVITKYQFASTHPQRMLTYNKRIIVPSYKSAPHLKKRYIRKRLRPPSEFENKWYFQSDFSPFPLVMLTTSACSFENYFVNKDAESNNITLYSVNTILFNNKNFKETSFTTYGYHPNATTYLYATPNGSDKVTQKELIYLGNATQNKAGEENTSAIAPVSTQQKYGYQKWGNPFYMGYLLDQLTMYISNVQPGVIWTGKPNETVTNITKMSSPVLQKCRYNPWKDKGYKNKAYWVKVTELGKGWGDEPSSDLKIEGFPLWIMLWGWEDWTNKLQKLQHMYDSYALVIVSDYIKPKLPFYVFVSDSFAHGQPPYHLDIQTMPLNYWNNWYPCWQYQHEAINDILSTGPAVYKGKQNIHAHLGYTFRFKWGGNPTTFDNISDPSQQPSYALPNKIQQGPEIQDPTTDAKTTIYPFDIRRGFITQTAAKRLKKDSKTAISMFTDGDQYTTKFSIPIQTFQEEETSQTSSSEEEDKTPLQLQLNQLRQHREQLRHRYRQLTQLLQTTKSTTQKLE